MADYIQTPAGVIIPVKSFSAPELKEIATTANGRDITRGYIEGNPILLSQDTILRERGGYDLKLYEELRRDDQVKSVFEQRRLAVVSKEWGVTPGAEDARAEEAAEFIEQQLRNISFDSVTDKMLWGIFYGYAVGECLWAKNDRQIVLDKIKVRRQKRFAFGPDFQLKLRTSAQPFGEPLPERKFWHYSCGADNDDEPYGLGLAHWLYWPVFFKRNGIKFWMFFLEKFGQPTAKGTYPVNAQAEERTKLLQALGAISTETGIIVPEGMQIELLEAARSGTADYDALCARMDASIAKVIIGHTGSSDATPGRLGGEDNAMAVRDDIVKADSDLICESLNKTVITWLTEWNFGPDVAPPTVYRELRSAADINTSADGLGKLVDMGMRIKKKWAHEKFMIPEAEEDDEVLERIAQPAAQPAFPGPAFSENGRDIVDAQADKFDEVSAVEFKKILEPIKRLVETADSLEEIRDGLIKLYPDMDEKGFAGLLQQALTAATLAGRSDVKDGV